MSIWSNYASIMGYALILENEIWTYSSVNWKLIKVLNFSVTVNSIGKYKSLIDSWDTKRKSRFKCNCLHWHNRTVSHTIVIFRVLVLAKWTELRQFVFLPSFKKYIKGRWHTGKDVCMFPILAINSIYSICKL